jgi:hypothetical protein
MRTSKTPIIFAVFLVVWLLSTAAFIGLKCFGVLSWSWWWLLVPVLGTPALAILAVGTVVCCALLLSMSSRV